MIKPNIDQKSIKALFSDNKADFLIPDYQRPYAWSVTECQTLWEDTFSFAIPGNDYQKFKSGDEYFLGPIVTFKNSENKLENKLEFKSEISNQIRKLRKKKRNEKKI